MSDHNVWSQLLGIAKNDRSVGKHGLAELKGICTWREIVDRIRAEVRREHECVGADAAVEDVVWPADKRRGAAASCKRLTTRASVQHETDVPIAIEVLMETGLDRL